MTRLLRLARIQFLIASLTLFVAGAIWGILLGAQFSLARLLLGYLIVFPAHLSVSFSNDYFDVDVDSFGKPTLFTGGSGVLVNYPQLRRPAKYVAIALICLSWIIGLTFMIVYSYPYWFLGYIIICSLLGWFYSAPPLRLAYRGLGELSTAFTGGCLVPMMGYLVMQGRLNSDGFLFTVPLIFFGLAFIITVEIPDLEIDRQGKKYTWVTRIGRKNGFNLIGSMLLVAAGIFYFFQRLYTIASPVDSRLFVLFALPSLGAGIFAMLKKPIEPKIATRYVNAILICLALFFILMDGYLITLLIRR